MNENNMNSYRIRLIVIFTLYITIHAKEDSEELKECGQYGFNCLDEKTLEFCPIVVDGVTDIVQVYECDANFTCDEDNPSYCTPKEAPKKLLQEGKSKDEHQGNGRVAKYVGDELYFGDDDFYYREARAAAAVPSREDPCACESTTLSEETTITTTTDLNEESADLTTINITPTSPFYCDSYGFFADPNNSSFFWHCDVPINGIGFLLRHMKCGHDRFFDVTFKTCVLEGTIRQERKDNSDSDLEIGKKKIKYTTDCKNRKPGKYADEFDCHVYHICLSKQFSPAIQMSFVCPRQTAYDCISRSCTIAAFKRCEVKNQTSNNINCTTPMRFRSIDDCRSYFVCFVDNVIEIKCPKFYKFDDDSMECLPEKVANCKEYPV